MKLSKKAAASIAAKINTIVVGNAMMEDSKIKSQWWQSVAEAYIQLEDEFGIGSPNTQQYRELMENGFFVRMRESEDEARSVALLTSLSKGESENDSDSVALLIKLSKGEAA